MGGDLFWLQGLTMKRDSRTIIDIIIFKRRNVELEIRSEYEFEYKVSY